MQGEPDLHRLGKSWGLPKRCSERATTVGLLTDHDDAKPFCCCIVIPECAYAGFHLLCTLRLLRYELLRLALARSLLRKYGCELSVVCLIDLACQWEALWDLQAPPTLQFQLG